MILRILMVVGVWLMVALICPRAIAGPPVLLVLQDNIENDADYSPYENRLRAELTADGYSVSTTWTRNAGEPGLQNLSGEPFSSPIVIAISLLEQKVTGYVWVAHPTKGGGMLRPIPPQPRSEPAAAIFAVKATEVLRGILLELEYKSQTGPVEVSPIGKSQPPTPTQPDRSSPTRKAPKLDDTARPNSTKSSVGRQPLNPPPGATPPRQLRNWCAEAGPSVMQGMHNSPIAAGALLGFARRWTNWELALQFFDFVPNSLSLEERWPGSRSIKIQQWQLGPALRHYHAIAPEVSIFEGIDMGLQSVHFSGTDRNDPSLDGSGHALVGYAAGGLGLQWMPNVAFGITLGSNLVFTMKDVDIKESSQGPALAQVAAPLFRQHLGVRATW